MANFSTRKGHCIYTRMSGIHSSSTDCKTKHQSTETTEPWQTPGEGEIKGIKSEHDIK